MGTGTVPVFPLSPVTRTRTRCTSFTPVRGSRVHGAADDSADTSSSRLCRLREIARRRSRRADGAGDDPRAAPSELEGQLLDSSSLGNFAGAVPELSGQEPDGPTFDYAWRADKPSLVELEVSGTPQRRSSIRKRPR